MRRWADGGMRALARVLVHVFFRRIEVRHGERLPAGPVVLVANHLNGLVDGLLLMAALDRYPRFLGKSTLFRIAPLWPFLKFAGVIPVHRASDGGAGGQNDAAFATCHAILQRGGMVALFPEGISHDESSLQPLRTGAARIALGAGLEGVQTVAVGLVYDAKARFRSRALVQVAEPVGVVPGAGPDAVHHLTEDLAAQLTSVSPTYASWEQADALARVAEVVVRPAQRGLPADVDLADRTDVAQRLAQAEHHRAGQPGVYALRAAYAEYARDLDLLGLRDEQVAARYAQGSLRLSLAWSITKVLVALPLAAVGVAVHIIPFQIMKQLAKKPTNEGIKATVKLLGCFALFTLVYVVLGVLVAQAFGPWAGLAAALAAPASGYVAVRLAERVKRIGGVIEGSRTVRHRRDVLQTVFAHRTAVVDAATSVLAAS